MAQTFAKRVTKYFSKFNLQESYATIVLVGIIVVVLGLLVANYFTKRSQEIGSGETTQSQEEAAKSAGEYKVAAGDSLSLIAEKHYGNRDLWPVLARVNKIQNPNKIFVDTNLTIPAKNEAETIREQMTQTSYKVAQGETLFIIAEKVYGDGSKWPLLARANKVGQLSNGNPLIFADSTLVIPR